MQIVIPLFDRFTALDAVGPFQVLVRLPGAKIVFAAERPRAVSDESRVLILHARPRSLRCRTRTSSSSRVDPARPIRGRQPPPRLAYRGRPDQHLDHLGLHRIADPGRGGPP